MADPVGAPPARRDAVIGNGVAGLARPAVRNSSVTIDRILAAAEMEFGKKGLDGAKIEDIARAAGVSKQLIYHYFNNKGDLYSEMLVLISQESYEKLLAIDYGSLDPEQAIRSFVGCLFDRYRDSSCSAMVTLDQGIHAGAQVRYNRKSEILRNSLMSKLQSALTRGQAAGKFNPDLTVEMLHFMSVIMISGCISYRHMFNRYARVNLDHPEEVDFWRAFSVDFFMKGISA
jgi:AcrR family transcriptional regulator